jgi:hypothetical protein
MKVEWKDVFIFGLVLAVVVMVLSRVSSGFSPAPAPKSGSPSVDDVKVMLQAGTPEVNVIVSLIKSGVPSDQAEQLVMQAKKV